MPVRRWCRASHTPYGAPFAAGVCSAVHSVSSMSHRQAPGASVPVEVGRCGRTHVPRAVPGRWVRFACGQALQALRSSRPGSISRFLQHLARHLQPEHMFPSRSCNGDQVLKRTLKRHLLCLDFRATFEALQVDEALFSFTPWGRPHSAQWPPSSTSFSHII